MSKKLRITEEKTGEPKVYVIFPDNKITVFSEHYDILSVINFATIGLYSECRYIPLI
jgi:hypothetical protein